MKPIIKTVLFATIMLTIAINSGRISKVCIKNYETIVSCISQNVYVPIG
ncbi:hypothetical protein M0G43_00185 [Subsaxibacter sp. CAU 1640]|nr:hypothetical protein [Subsaxibacter sp. CAU 1640]MCK7588981.1 hypothetical protein [Subsaxibacter sp. CAU 1640]